MGTAPLADRPRPWPSWSALILVACGYFLAAVAARAGDTSEFGCPFCESADDHRLSALAIEGEKYLRIDYCQSCRAYLKTYDGQGSEPLFLADWTSLHLDIIARDRGLKRLANSLYEV